MKYSYFLSTNEVIFKIWSRDYANCCTDNWYWLRLITKIATPTCHNNGAICENRSKYQIRYCALKNLLTTERKKKNIRKLTLLRHSFGLEFSIVSVWGKSNEEIKMITEFCKMLYDLFVLDVIVDKNPSSLIRHGLVSSLFGFSL